MYVWITQVDPSHPTSGHTMCKPCLCSHSCGKSCIEQERYTHGYSEEPVETVSQEDLDCSSVCKQDDLIIQALGIAFGGLHVDETDVHPSGCDAISHDGSVCNQTEMVHLPHNEKMEKGLNKVPGSEALQADASLGKVVESSSTSQSCSNVGSLAHTDLMPLPTSVMLVSAMKGGREQQGMPQKTNLRVKWAPEVYDPPVTSSSNTVKGHHHHHRSKPKRKDNSKIKYSKGKSSRGSSSEKRPSYRRSTCDTYDPRFMRLHFLSEKVSLNGFGEPVDDVVRSTVTGPEKSGSSLYT